MAKGTTFEGDVLTMLLCGLPISSFSATGGTTKLWAAIHTGDPSGGNQGTNEVTLTAYTRISIDRSTASAGWTVTAGTSSGTAASASPNTAVTFPTLTSTSTATASFFSIGHSSSGTGKLYYTGSLSPTVALGQNVALQLTTGTALTEA